ncbi:MAG: ATP-binding protein [Janthinobacterium lividum]
MRVARPASIRTRLTAWYICVLAVTLLVYAVIVFVFQYAALTKQIFHDEVQDIVTVEGLLYFDEHGSLQLRQDYYSRPQSHLLIDRMMEVRDSSNNTIYRSPTLRGLSLGGRNQPNEGDAGFNEHIARLADGSYAFVISHVHGMDGRMVLIRLGYSLSPLRERMVQFLVILLIAFSVVLAVAAVAGQFIAKGALLPLEQMSTRAASITVHNLGDRLIIQNVNDELGHMGLVFNHLLERLEQSFVQLQRFTADAAHELRTPLASLRAVGEVALQKEEDAAGSREALSSILEEASRLNETVDSLLLLARTEANLGSEDAEVFSIGEPVYEITNLLGVLLEDRQITIETVGEDASRTRVKAKRSLLRVALMNVLHNALKFSPRASVLRISYDRPATPEHRIRLTIEDEGTGIAPGEHERIFDRFYRGQQPSEGVAGTGLGLAIARLIIERSGGSIRYDEAALYGARCIVELPAYMS